MVRPGEPVLSAAVEPSAYAASCVTLLSPAGMIHRGQVWAPSPAAVSLTQLQ